MHWLAMLRLFFFVSLQAACLWGVSASLDSLLLHASPSHLPTVQLRSLGRHPVPPVRSFQLFDPFAAITSLGGEDDSEKFRLPDFFEEATRHVMTVPEETHESEIVEEVADISSGMDVGLITNAQEFRLNSFAGFVATMVSATLTFPIDTLKTRLQAGKSGVPRRRGIWGLYSGLIPSMIVFCPTVSVFVGLSYWLKAQLVGYAFFVDRPKLQFMAGLLAGALSNLLLSFYRVPTSMMVKLLQTGICPDAKSSLKQIFWTDGCWKRLFTVWVVVLLKDIPNGALRIGIYHFYQECLGFLEAFGFSAVSQRTLSGIVAGMTLGVIANPIDLVVTRAMTDVHSNKDEYSVARTEKDGTVVLEADTRPHPLKAVNKICSQIYAESGIAGFFAGAMVRALSRIPSTCIWFATFDIMKGILLRRWY